MAFATANIVRKNVGTVNMMAGTWTGNAGDDVGTITGNGYAINAEVDANVSTGPGEVILYRITNSGGTWTVTIPYHQTVTAGTFEIEFI